MQLKAQQCTGTIDNRPIKKAMSND